MRRVKLILEYDGTGYAGWQRQLNAVTVQQRLEEALGRLIGVPISVTGASRTDAGVHALWQVVHFDTDSPVPDDKFSYALNTVLPRDIRVRASMSAAPDFHARFGASGKIYRYVIYNAPHAPAIGRDHMAHAIYPLDEQRMDHEAGAALGRHDFAPFAASGSAAKNTVRTLFRARVLRCGGRVTLWVYGDGFLYNMVRILAGTLIAVGSGKLPEGTIARALNGGRRMDLGITAPAGGLTLMRVFYDGDGDGGEYFDRLIADETDGW